MDNIQKLKYDLAMQCALVDTLAEKQEDPTASTRDEMLKNFEANYEFYCTMDQSHFKEFIDSLDELEKRRPY